MRNLVFGLAMCLIVLRTGTAPASAAVIIGSEDFSYSNGSLTTMSGGKWSAHSNPGSVAVQVQGGAAVLEKGAGSREDVSFALSDTASAGETFSAAFDVSITGGSEEQYFAHFRDNGTMFLAKVYVTSHTSGGYTLGIGNSGLDAKLTSALSFGTTYRPVVTYSFDTGVATLTLGSQTISTTTQVPNQGMRTFALRQASGNSTQRIDNIVVSVPEPAGLAAAGIVALTALQRRRRAD